MEKMIDELINEIKHCHSKTSEWYLDVCKRIEMIMTDKNISDELKKRLLNYSDPIFMMKEAILDNK